MDIPKHLLRSGHQPRARSVCKSDLGTEELPFASLRLHPKPKCTGPSKFGRSGSVFPFQLPPNHVVFQLEKERQAAHDRDDLLHYARLEGIQLSQGRVDNWNFYCRHSLNWDKRQRDLEQIYWENRQLMKRLAEKRSDLAQRRWQQDWHREQLIRNSLARYPRGTRSCQVGTERQRQRPGGSSAPTSTPRQNPGRSPDRVCFPGSSRRTGLAGERFWGKRNEDFSTKEADLPGGASLEKPVVEAVSPRIKRPPASRLREKLRFSGESPAPALEMSELSAGCAEPL
ncbi:uncharacterized protein LOC143827723 [Paroedura picta]|uniref:uncharacterized protein LOC143827723 n=1 Tax=Paroedura picta TaxID=143630 RepID=UPI004055E825